jgi:hypothetical protein
MHLILARELKEVGYTLQSRPSLVLPSNMGVTSRSHHLVIRIHRPHSPRKGLVRLMDSIVERSSESLTLQL